MQDVLDPYRQRLRQSSELDRALRDGRHLRGLTPAAAGWVLQEIAAALETPALIVMPHEAEALECLEAAVALGDDPAWAFFPAPTLTPFQQAEVALSVRAQESAALARLLDGQATTIVCAARALVRALPDPRRYAAGIVDLSPGERIELDKLVERLIDDGYERVDLVTEVGQAAVRGGVIDVYSPGHEWPLRLDFFGDEIESIRHFDVDSQRSLDSLEHIRLLPLDVFEAGVVQAAALAEELRRCQQDELGMRAAEHLAALEAGSGFPGWESFLPMLEAAPRGLLDWCGDRVLVVAWPQAVDAELERHAALLQRQYASRLESGGLHPPPDRLEPPLALLQRRLAASDYVIDDISAEGGVDFGASATDIMHRQLPRFPREVETARARGESVVVVAPQAHHERMRRALEGHGVEVDVQGGVDLADGSLRRGFRLPVAGVSFFAEEQLFPRRQAAQQRHRSGAFFSSLRDLRVGDFVVHAEHGIGRLVGLRTVTRQADPDMRIPMDAADAVAARQGDEVEVLELAYAGDRQLLMPLDRLDQLQRYSGIEGMQPRLDQLGGASWNRTKSRVKRSMQKMARELLELYAQRELCQAPAMYPDSDLQRQFEAAFEFDETDDQLAATQAIKDDLERTRPMDRLLCGDVGFGKTEVAMRAAFKAVDSGYQVAVLAPTTILADQHLRTFESRLADFPVTVEVISRFRTGRQIRETRERLGEGKIDILVGTHRLLSRDVEFAKLGLLIIDEEQRFGVAQKERLKQLKHDVHVLSMSATPIPRTLQLAIAGVRDLSLIESPPKDRMAIETQIVPHSGDLIREAVLSELERGGQVFYVFNQVVNIDRVAGELRQLIPEARITVGHGQLNERELSQRMQAFRRRDYDVLLTTTIIENGIDLPNVNTILVHRADRFGLSQLYQLRGRVGRSNQLAYCYLLVPDDRVLPSDAQKRLAAIREFTDLGAGFRIAGRDLEIRGAGNLLGGEQSGHIAEVGIETYLRMLEDTVRELQGEARDEPVSVSIDLGSVAAIPTDYIPDANLRMSVYRRLAARERSLGELQEELRDRFGPPPKSVEELLSLADLKHLAEELRVQTISRRRGKLVMRLRRDTKIDVDRLIQMVAERPEASFTPQGVLTLPLGSSDAVAEARAALAALSDGGAGGP